MPDFGFVGGAYEAANLLQDNQKLINWFVETDQNQGAKTPMALLGCPGLVDLGQSVYTGEVRDLWPLPGGTQAIVVVGSKVLLMTVATPATATSRATFSYALLGTLSSSSGQVCTRDTGAGRVVAIVDGTNLYSYSFITNTFRTISDPAFLGSYRIAEIDGWLIFAKPSSQTFYVAPNYWDGASALDATYFALKDNFSDNIVAHIEQNREIWLVGESTTEVWSNAGGNYFPFQRQQGVLLQVGCAATNSLCRYGSGLIWLGRSERGGVAVVMTKGYEWEPVRNPAFSYALSKYPVISDAIGYIYTEDSHEFYVLTFPTANVTWVLDLTTGLWHQRASYGAVTGRHRSNCQMAFQGMQIVGDAANGKVWWMTRTAYTEGSDYIVCLRRTPHVWDRSDRKRVRHNRLQIEFVQGDALPTGQGSDPQAMLRFSNDGGRTWGNEHWSSIGKIGETKNRCIWRRLGIARDRVYEVRFSDPVKRDIVGASLIAEELGA
ncbi:MAG TPA: hypothetical protein VIN03_16705 [Roseateles sp.]